MTKILRSSGICVRKSRLETWQFVPQHLPGPRASARRLRIRCWRRYGVRTTTLCAGSSHQHAAEILRRFILVRNQNLWNILLRSETYLTADERFKKMVELIIVFQKRDVLALVVVGDAVVEWVPGDVYVLASWAVGRGAKIQVELDHPRTA